MEVRSNSISKHPNANKIKFHTSKLFQPLYGTVMPLLMCVTLLSNSIIILVLSRPRFSERKTEKYVDTWYYSSQSQHEFLSEWTNAIYIFYLDPWIFNNYNWIIFHNIFPSMRSPTNIVLLSMAVCDLLTIALPAPWWLSSFTCQSISFLVRYLSKWSLSSCDTLALHYVHRHYYPLHVSKHFRT